MLKLEIGQETFTVGTVTVRKIHQTLDLQEKINKIIEEKKGEKAMIDAMIDYLVEIFSIKKGEEVTYQFDRDYIMDNMPLNQLNKKFDEIFNTVLKVFGGEEIDSKN